MLNAGKKLQAASLFNSAGEMLISSGGLSVESAKRMPTLQDGIGPGAPIRID